MVQWMALSGSAEQIAVIPAVVSYYAGPERTGPVIPKYDSTITPG